MVLWRFTYISLVKGHYMLKRVESDILLHWVLIIIKIIHHLIIIIYVYIALLRIHIIIVLLLGMRSLRFLFHIMTYNLIS